MPPKSRAGSRDSRFRNGWGRTDKGRITWLRTLATGQLSVQMKSPSQFDEENGIKEKSEEGPTYLLVISIPGRARGLVWDMCSMTEEELNATRQFFNNLFDMAEPVVRDRDKVAQDAASKGDDSYNRTYRPVPQLVIREGAISPDSQRIHDGSESVPKGDGSRGDSV